MTDIVPCCWCEAPCAVETRGHRARPERSYCPDCRAEHTRHMAAIPAALAVKRARFLALEADLLAAGGRREQRDVMNRYVAAEARRMEEEKAA